MGKHRGPNPASARDLEAVQQMLGLQPSTDSPKASATTTKDPIFVCIDCEAFEHNQAKITEIGVAVLDTRETSHLNSSSPLPAWFEKIKYAHYRPVEYARLRNKTFIQGCPDQFNFGPSTWVKLADMRRILCNIFAAPTQLDRAADFSIPTTTTTTSSDQPQPDPRNIIFLAHGAGNDTTYLRHLSFDLSNLQSATAVGSRIAQTLDTQRLAGSTKKSPLSLHRLCLCLHLFPVNLHNAGNDAGYTLQALIALAVNENQNPAGFAREVREGEFSVGRKLPPVRFERGWKAPVVWAGSTREGNASSSSAEKGREGGIEGTTVPQVGVGRDGDEVGGEGGVETTMTTTKPERPSNPAQSQEREQERARRGASSSAPAPTVAEDKAGETSKRKRKREGLGDAAEDG